MKRYLSKICFLFCVMGFLLPVTAKADTETPVYKEETSLNFVGSSIQRTNENNVFTDVETDDWFYDSVLWAVENKITSGLKPTLFGPDVICTRAQAVTFIWRSKGSPEPESSAMPFGDVPDGSYYYKSVQWAVENNITTGLSATSFGPDEYCTRAQIVTFLWRSEGSPVVEAVNPFTDVSNDSYYTNPVLWAVKNNITTGLTTTEFGPNAYCTRAQIVAFLYRCAKCAENEEDIVPEMVIVKQPENAIGKLGQKVQLSVKAEGGKAPYKYQWQYSLDGIVYLNINSGHSEWASGYNEDTVTITLNNSNTNVRWVFRCMVKDADGTILYTKNVKLTSTSLKISVQPEDQYGRVLELTTFVVEVDGDSEGLTYQWQEVTSSGSVRNITSKGQLINNKYDSYSGYDTNRLTVCVTAFHFAYGYKYRCVITDADGNQTVSNEGKILESVVISKHPEDTEAGIGETAVFEVTAQKGKAPYTYYWEYTFDGSSYYSTVYDSNSNRLEVVIEEEHYAYNYKYRCVVKDSNGDIIRSSLAGFVGDVQLSLYIKDYSGSVEIPAGSSTELWVEAGGGTEPYSYRWYRYNDNTDKWNYLASGRTYKASTPYGKYSTSRYRIVVTDADGASAQKEWYVLGDRDAN